MRARVLGPLARPRPARNVIDACKQLPSPNDVNNNTAVCVDVGILFLVQGLHFFGASLLRCCQTNSVSASSHVVESAEIQTNVTG